MNGPAKSKVASQPCNIQSKRNGLNQMSENKLTKKPKVNQKISTASTGNSEVKKKSQLGSLKKNYKSVKIAKENLQTW